MSSDGFTLLMPCLNEAETIGTCIAKAKQSIETLNLNAEILIADNGSIDGSQEIARKLGARVISVEQMGYGAALIAGIESANFDFVIMGDADDSYAWDKLEEFTTIVNLDLDILIGNRFKGGIAKDAMPFLHKYLGNPVLSFLGRLFFKLKIGDFHCGMRAFNRKKIIELNLECFGMEFASEMLVKAKLANYRIDEVPTTLTKDGRSRSPHLRTWRDGWRHLKFLLLLAPNWLFALPATVLMSFGLGIIFLLNKGYFQFGNVRLGLQTLVIGSFMFLSGYQILNFWIIAKLTFSKQFKIASNKLITLIASNYDKTIFASILIFLLSILGLVIQFSKWYAMDFGALNTDSVVRNALIYGVGLTISIQNIFATFILGILDIEHKK